MTKTLLAALAATLIAVPAVAQEPNQALLEARFNMERREVGWHLVDMEKGCMPLEDLGDFAEGRLRVRTPQDLLATLKKVSPGARLDSEPGDQEFAMVLAPHQGRTKEFIMIRGGDKCRTGLRHATKNKG
jgi:hypothetical protein